jgi:hypothetical protein
MSFYLHLIITVVLSVARTLLATLDVRIWFAFSKEATGNQGGPGKPLKSFLSPLQLFEQEELRLELPTIAERPK